MSSNEIKKKYFIPLGSVGVKSALERQGVRMAEIGARNRFKKVTA